MELGSADEQKPAKDGTVEAWGRSADNPIGGWYGLKKGLRGRFGMYVPPLMEALGLAEVEHNPRQPHARRSDRAAGRQRSQPRLPKLGVEDVVVPEELASRLVRVGEGDPHGRFGEFLRARPVGLARGRVEVARCDHGLGRRQHVDRDAVRLHLDRDALGQVVQRGLVASVGDRPRRSGAARTVPHPGSAPRPS